MKYQDNYEAVLRSIVSDATAAYLKAGGRYMDVANGTGLSAQTIKRLVAMETGYPRFNTMLRVLNFYGVTLSHRMSPRLAVVV